MKTFFILIFPVDEVMALMMISTLTYVRQRTLYLGFALPFLFSFRPGLTGESVNDAGRPHIGWRPEFEGESVNDPESWGSLTVYMDSSDDKLPSFDSSDDSDVS